MYVAVFMFQVNKKQWRLTCIRMTASVVSCSYCSKYINYICKSSSNSPVSSQLWNVAL